MLSPPDLIFCSADRISIVTDGRKYSSTDRKKQKMPAVSSRNHTFDFNLI